jgi:hypothetical protein
MKEDEKVAYVASEQFNAIIERGNGVPIYQATERHGLLEWAAKLNRLDDWDTYLTLGVWDTAEPETIGIRASVAQLHENRGKFVRDFSELVAIHHDPYATLDRAVSQLLSRALEASFSDLSVDEASIKIIDPRAYAPASMLPQADTSSS